MVKKIVISVFIFIVFLIFVISLPFLIQEITRINVLFVSPGKINFERKFQNVATQYINVPRDANVSSFPLPIGFHYPPFILFEYLGEGPIVNYYDDLCGSLKWENNYGKYELVYYPFYIYKIEGKEIGVSHHPEPNIPLLPKSDKVYIVTLLIEIKSPTLTKEDMMIKVKDSERYCLRNDKLDKIHELISPFFRRKIAVKIYRPDSEYCTIGYTYEGEEHPTSIEVYFDQTMRINVNNVTKVYYDPRVTTQFDPRF